ncbi:MAG: YraN family protein [Planctomycetes bacterium]|nr:YraN family protein [Planctomycetota bacterium]
MKCVRRSLRRITRRLTRFLVEHSRWLRRSSVDCPTDPRPVQGRRAEWLAGWWLRAQGAHLLARRFPTPFAEVDLVVVDGSDLVVVEVKSRHGPGEINIHADQRARLVRAAQWIDAEYGRPTSGIRIDVIGVHWSERRWGWPTIEREVGALGECDRHARRDS